MCNDDVIHALVLIFVFVTSVKRNHNGKSKNELCPNSTRRARPDFVRWSPTKSVGSARVSDMSGDFVRSDPVRSVEFGTYSNQ